MSTALKTNFPKTWSDPAAQVQVLQGRGLIVADPATAEQFLRHFSYYRFSGYCIAFEASRHAFISGVTFEQVVASYEFDIALRDLLTEALEIVEVDLRSAVAARFGEQYGPFGHTNASRFHKPSEHPAWLKRLQKESKRSSELFVKHFKHAYLEFPNLPLWVATEVMSFGALSQMWT